MNYKDTIMNVGEMQQAVIANTDVPMGQAIANRQAEITWDKAIKEVIGFLDKPCPHTGGLEEQQMRAIDCPKCFDTQIKEWSLAP